MPDPEIQPLEAAHAKKLAREIVNTGVVQFSEHARTEMTKDGLEATDCLNVLRGGNYEYPELEKGEWRYRVGTPQMMFVITFKSETRLRVVTGWRNKR